jgi:dolichyl-phosphate-mannose-protein mannosyltransferase
MRLIFSMLAILLMAALSGHAENLVKNGGFDDEVFQYWKKEVWRGDHGSLEIVGERVKNGARALKIEDTVAENDLRYEQMVQVEPDTFYLLSGWIASENIEPATAKYGAIIGLDGGLTGKVYAGNLKGTHDWTFASLYFKTSSAHKTVIVQVRLGMFFSTVTGTAYFDDIALEKVSKPQAEFFTLAEPDNPDKKTEVNQVAPAPQLPDIIKNIPPFVWLLLIGFLLMALNIFFTLQREKKKKE